MRKNPGRSNNNNDRKYDSQKLNYSENQLWKLMKEKGMDEHNKNWNCKIKSKIF
jgi:hypothetical protein